jgi:hypothetical protein
VGVGGLNESDRVGGEGSERESECWGRRENVRYQLEEAISMGTVGSWKRRAKNWHGGLLGHGQ